MLHRYRVRNCFTVYRQQLLTVFLVCTRLVVVQITVQYTEQVHIKNCKKISEIYIVVFQLKIIRGKNLISA